MVIFSIIIPICFCNILSQILVRICIDHNFGRIDYFNNKFADMNRIEYLIELDWLFLSI
jgi:hypothetical protein